MARLRTGDKHKEILEASLTLFMSKGVANASIKDIANEAKVAVGTVYLYFTDKDDVVAACADRFAEEHLLETTKLDLKKSARSEIRKYLLSRYRNWKRVSDGTPQAAELAQAILRLRPEKIVEFEALFVQTLSRLIQSGIEQKQFKKQRAEDSARTLALSLAIFFPFPGREPPRRFTEKEFLDSINWFLETGLT
ncbi:MAG TPA: TetR/AcrR family transcriptional regulator [Blastocatellia bacterium]|nr:TetR/AcrR family transcriptional regulator [Blastocatellia bacterium]